ncbi:hypothetical protein CR513_49055, partial [Mucuna pruriens]
MKIDMNGKVHTSKAQLIAKGFKQIHGIGYNETFSLIAMLTSMWILLAIVLYHDYKIWHIDVKIAFLNGKLLMDQASRSYNLLFNEVVRHLGFIKNEDEPCIKKKKVSENTIILLVLYIDNILLIENDIPTIQNDLGEATYVFGIRIYRDKSLKLLGLSQSTYHLRDYQYRR